MQREGHHILLNSLIISQWFCLQHSQQGLSCKTIKTRDMVKFCCEACKQNYGQNIGLLPLVLVVSQALALLSKLQA